MLSEFREQDAEQWKNEHGAAHGEDLALRAYTSRLIGDDTRLVLFGGGNTSVKAPFRDLFGDEVDALFVKGSGAHLGAVVPESFPACRLDALRKIADLDSAAITDETLMTLLMATVLTPERPKPSVETLLHALIPGKFVDHCHADALLALTNRPNSEEDLRAIYGPGLLFVPYAMPGFALARQFKETWKERAAGASPVDLVILDRHGVFTWGDTAKESHERMIAAVDKAEAFLASRRGGAPSTALPYPRPDLPVADARPVVALLAGLRGAMTRASSRRWIVTLRQTEATRAFAGRPDLELLLQQGCATPDHVIRSKPWPLVVDAADPDDNSLGSKLDRDIAAFADRYRAYFERHSAASGAQLTMLDPWPRVVWVRGLGVIGIGATKRDADVAADIAEHTANILDDATAIGAYQAASERDIFDVEYWVLEQAKLTRSADGRAKNAGPHFDLGDGFASKVALVTGAASGIGLATARRLVEAGAHVVFTDRDNTMLREVTAPIAARFPGRVAHVACDVLSYPACEAAVSFTTLRFGGLDLVVSNAGNAKEGKLHTEAGDEALRFSLELNLLGHQHVSRAATQVFLRQGSGGCLLYNASKSAFNQGPDFGPYAIPKTALLALMRQYAIDLAPHGIRTGAVNADRIRTGLFTPDFVAARAKARNVGVDEYFKANLLKRETTADDVAEAFLYLAVAGATTGCVVTVDGGNAAAFPR